MFYYSKIEKKDNVYFVSFPNFKNINTYGETINEALTNAEEALNGCIESDFERGFKLPQPLLKKKKKYYKIYLRAHIEIAYKLKILRAKQSQIQLAEKLGISYQSYQKLENPRKCNPTIKTLEKIAKVLNKPIEIAVR